MDIEIKDGKVIISINQMLSTLTGDELLDLVQDLACEDAVIEAVCDQIVTGWTKNGSHGAKGGNVFKPSTALDNAVRRIAESAHVIAKEEIAALVRHGQWREQHHEKIEAWAWEMYHSWPSDRRARCPEVPR